MIRIAAVGDVHVGEDSDERFEPWIDRVCAEADALLLAGDLTRSGAPSEAAKLAEELARIEIPIVTVLGNHDYQSEKQDEIAGLLRDVGVHVLEGDSVVLAGTFFEDFDLGGGPLVNQGDEDIFVAKLDPAGGHVWSLGFGDEAQQTARGLSVDGAGNILITGSLSTESGVDFGGGMLMSGGGSDALAVKLDAAGKTLWSSRFGDAPDQDGYDTAVDSAGNLVLAGVFRGSVNFGGEALMTAGDYDLFLAKLAP